MNDDKADKKNDSLDESCGVIPSSQPHLMNMVHEIIGERQLGLRNIMRDKHLKILRCAVHRKFILSTEKLFCLFFLFYLTGGLYECRLYAPVTIKT